MMVLWKYIVALCLIVIFGCGLWLYLLLHPWGLTERLDLASVQITPTDCRAVVASVRNSAMDWDYIQISKECDGDRAIVSRIFDFDSAGYVGMK